MACRDSLPAMIVKDICGKKIVPMMLAKFAKLIFQEKSSMREFYYILLTSFSCENRKHASKPD